ncbi:hypothetical protein AB0B31_25480 [Catellatospora citrea]|uniref:hypothetical protein n=1 Tax=Catellatospora citrea TaxID=53366 RepID=UPI00340E16A6
MSEVARSVRSPLTLLEQWRDRADGARLREVVITGYTIDLAFLERFVIPTARALGARITILGDSSQGVHDPVDVRRAGTLYQHGHAVCARAFHPKLVVLAGDDTCVVAIGSGNPTLSGWGYNRELWLTARSSRTIGPQLVADVADWLQDLPDAVAMASWIAATLRQVAERIRPDTFDARWSSARVYGNLRAPLLVRLPAEPVRELRLAAPYYDPAARAATALVERMKPTAVRIAVQPSVALYDGAALVEAAELAAEQEFRVIGPGAARHGKLIEWETADGAVVGVTGSANITASALLMSTDQGGNCELAVIAPHGESLFPEGESQLGAVLRRMASGHAEVFEPRGAAPVILGCALSDGVLLIELAMPAVQSVAAETSPSGAPGTWHWLGFVAAGQRTARFLVPEMSGGAVRAVVEADGLRWESAAVFVTDPERCRPGRDPGDGPRVSRNYDHEDLFADPQVAQRFTADLARLAQLAGASPRPVGAASRTPVSVRADRADRWADFLEDCDRMLGPGLAGLVFPRRPATEQVEASAWSIDEVDDTEVADGEDEGVLDSLSEEAATDSRLSVPAVAPAERERYRRFAARWVDAVTDPRGDSSDANQPAVVLRMAVASLYLTLLAAGIWEDGDGWRDDLRRLSAGLVPDDRLLDELPGEAFDHLYALLAVVITTLRQGTRLHGGRHADIVATDAWRAASEWVAEADCALAEHLLLPSTRPFARVVSARELWDTVKLAEQSRRDPYAEVLSNLAGAGLAVRQQDGVWWLDSAGTSPYRTAARVAAEFARVSGGAVAVATTLKHRVLVAVAGQWMVLVDSRMPVWRLYQLTATRTPSSLTAGQAGPPLGAHLSPLAAPPPEVDALCASTGADLAALARSLQDTQ